VKPGGGHNTQIIFQLEHDSISEGCHDLMKKGGGLRSEKFDSLNSCIWAQRAAHYSQQAEYFREGLFDRCYSVHLPMATQKACLIRMMSAI
jgi:hypothetical protein